VKADRSVSELGWQMRHAPFQPVGPAWRILGSGGANPTWLPYLQGHAGGAAAASRHLGELALPA
jgi:hypothetical protein